MTLPLDEIRVLDLTNVIAGPLCAYQLAMLGAEVIKVENPATGDLGRKMGSDPALGQIGMGASFLAINAGKRSMTLNLKHPRAKEIFEQLVSGADVVLENFRPGTMDRLGLGYERLKAVNPRLVYCAVSGFGQTGPLAQRPSYDQIIQGYSGLMALTGDAETSPLRAGYVVCDTMAAVHASFAIAAALYRRERTGAGEYIDVSMLDSTVTTSGAWPISNYKLTGKVPQPLGNESHTSTPSGTFAVKAGRINIVCNEQRQFESLCDAIGAPELKSDPRFIGRIERDANRPALTASLEACLTLRTYAEWEPILTAANVPIGPILTVDEIAAHPQLAARGLFKRFENVPGIERDISVPRLGFTLASGEPDVGTPPPVLGANTSDLLESLGLSPAEIAALRDDGAI